MNLFKPEEGAINTLIAPHYFIDESLYITKKGAIAATFEVRGIDFECLTDERLEDYTQRLHSDLRNLPVEFRIYQHIIKTKGVDLVYHRARELYSYKLYRTLLYEPKSINQGLPSANSLRVPQDALEEQKRVVYSAIQSLSSSPLGSGLKLLRRDEAFDFLRAICGGNRELEYSDHIDYHVAPETLDIHKRYVVADSPAIALSLRELPRTSFPNLLSGLASLDCDLVLCTEWKRVNADKATGLLNDKQDHFDFAKKFKSKKAAIGAATGKGEGKDGPIDQSAAKSISELGDLQVRITNSGEFLGEFSLGLLLRGDRYHKLSMVADTAISIVGNLEGRLAVDGIGALATYVSLIPGSKQLRPFLLPSLNYADMALMYAPPAGDKRNKHLRSEYLAILETNYRTPYYFNLHEGDLLGALLFGVMGSGKSFLTNLLIDKSQKYNPFTFILDVGNSYRHLARKHKGSYIELSRIDNSYTINPFDCEKSPQNLEFLSSFIHVLLGTSGYEPTPTECREIDKAVKVAGRLSDLSLSASLMERLYNWTGDGRYAYLFDNAEDTLKLSDFQCFELAGRKRQASRAAVLLHLPAHLAGGLRSQKRRKTQATIFSDEAWKFLSTLPLLVTTSSKPGKRGVSITAESASLPNRR
jgi:type IV secretory pathway VirB4 component